MDKDKIKMIQKELNIGTNWKFSYGKLYNPSHEGELKSAIVREFIIFGKSVEWLALTK
jgi:hypothetical protein